LFAAPLLCLVVAITDGDTIKARCGVPGAYQQVTIRINAIDAPEKRQAFGEVSRQHLAKLCFETRAFIIPRDTDKYGRTVGDVECQRRDVATEQVSAGMAWVYTKYSAARPDLAPLEATARARSVGLWSAPHTPPWEWRRAAKQRRSENRP
jgi:endonuclease YncB( thermonuclease family)